MDLHEKPLSKGNLTQRYIGIQSTVGYRQIEKQVGNHYLECFEVISITWNTSTLPPLIFA